MNNTNRALNRAFVLLCGLLLLAVGAAAAAVALIPAVRDGWQDAASAVDETVTTWLRQTPLADTGVSWIMPALLVVLVLVVILLAVFVLRQGHGRTGTALTAPTEHGTTIIDATVAEHAVQNSLADRPEFIASHVSTYRVRRAAVLKVSVTCRRGVSPKDAASIVEEDLLALDELLGHELPALIRISGGFRARVTKTTRLQ